MPKSKKPTLKQKVQPVAGKSAKESPAVKTAMDIFAQIKTKISTIDDKKVDEWQKKWLAMPEKRAKYGNIKDAPTVVGEELFAMTNDIIDFIQKQEGGKSLVFKKIKENIKGFMNNPSESLKNMSVEAKKMAGKGYVFMNEMITRAKTEIAKKQAASLASEGVKKSDDKTEKAVVKNKKQIKKNKK